MPWEEKEILEEKIGFIADWKKNEFTFSELCQRYGVSRPTGYLLINRFESEGVEGLKERSKRPKVIPHQTSEEIESELLRLKYRFPKWGPAKIKDFIIAEGIEGDFPAASTIGEIYKRHGLVKPRKKRKKIIPHCEPLRHCTAPNMVWSADFKGQFQLKNSAYCYPLTITDNFSRFLFACDGFLSPNCNQTIKTFTKVFEEFGLPDALRTDNGQPFCSVGITSLTRFTVWLLKLGVMPERISIGSPQENGRHERMHRTLKESAIAPNQHTLPEQQDRFEGFIHEYNYLRPHSALGGKRPSEVHQKSPREFPIGAPEVCYPNHFSLRKIKKTGEIKFANKRYFLSESLGGETVALEMLDQYRGIIFFGKMKLGLIDSKLEKIIRPY